MDKKQDNSPYLMVWFAFAAVCIFGSLLASALSAQAHPPSECFESPRCKYVQIETEHGAQRMVYVCE